MAFEIRASGAVLCSSSVPNLGYSHEVIKDMERNGLFLYCDGKKARRCNKHNGNCQKKDEWGRVKEEQ